MSKSQFTGTAMQPQRNRKLCQFNNDQYSNAVNGKVGIGPDTYQRTHIDAL